MLLVDAVDEAVVAEEVVGEDAVEDAVMDLVVVEDSRRLFPPL